jgi:hypothetical protein
MVCFDRRACFSFPETDMEYFPHINWLAVLVATIAAFMLGGLWFSPAMFAKAWVEAIGKTPEELPKPARSLVITFVTTLVMATALALIIGRMPPMSIIGAIRFGITVGIGVVFTGMISDYSFTGMPRTLLWIQGSYHIVMVTVMSVVLVYFR